MKTLRGKLPKGAFPVGYVKIGRLRSNHIDSLKSALREKNKFKQLIDIIKTSCNKPEITNNIIIGQVDDVITEYFQYSQKKIEEIG